MNKKKNVLIDETFFDEYLSTQGGIRKDLKKSYKFFQNLKPSKRRSLQAQSEDAISTMGITFQLYKGGIIDRSWPLDIIPRIINHSKWIKVELGLKQRIKALNLFIDDVYNQQRFLKLNPVL